MYSGWSGIGQCDRHVLLARFRHNDHGQLIIFTDLHNTPRLATQPALEAAITNAHLVADKAPATEHTLSVRAVTSVSVIYRIRFDSEDYVK